MDGAREKAEKRVEVLVFVWKRTGSRKRRTINQNPTLDVVRYR